MHKVFSFLKLHYARLAVCLITLTAALLRFHKLGAWSFWGDEVFSLSNKPDGFMLSLSTRLIHAAIAFWGANEFSARLFPALIGIATIPILYNLTAQIFGRQAGVISSALLAVSHWHIYWSQNARFYVLLLLFYTLAMVYFYLGIEKNRPTLLLLSLMFLGLAVQERLLALFLLPVMVIYLILLFILPFKRPAGLNLRNLLIYFAPGVIAAALIIAPYLGGLDQWMAGFGLVNSDPLWIFSGFIYYVGIPVICLGGLGMVYLLLKRNRAGLFFGLGAVVPLLGITFLSPFHYTANRYIFISLTSWVILASVAAYELFQQQKGEARLLAVGVFAILLATSMSEDYLYFSYQNGNRENWRAAIEFVRERQIEGDRVYIGNADVGDYYMGRRTIPMEKFKADQIALNDHRIWFIEDFTLGERLPNVQAWIQANAQQKASFDVIVRGRYFTMKVYLYDPACKVIQCASQ